MTTMISQNSKVEDIKHAQIVDLPTELSIKTAGSLESAESVRTFCKKNIKYTKSERF